MESGSIAVKSLLPFLRLTCKAGKFLKVSCSARLPLKFVNHRWLENKTVCESALELWEDISKDVKAVESKEITKPGNKSYEAVVEASKDKLIRAKLQFFKCVAWQSQTFLATFQK